MRYFAAAVLLLAVPLHAQQPMLWAGLTAGRFHIGYRRTPAQAGVVDVWYPAQGDGRRMTFRGYLRDRAGDLERFLTAQGISSTDIAAFIDGDVYAREGASVVQGRHPLVLIAQGNGQDAADQAILCEYLASRGYVIASVPSPMVAHPMTDEAQIGVFAEEQRVALEAAKRAVSKQFRVDERRIAVVGHSFGARAALLAGMGDGSIGAIVSLDGGIGTATGLQYFQQAPSFRQSARLPPLLHVYELLDGFMRPDFRFIEGLALRSLELEQTSDMHHIHFTTYGFAAAAIPGIAKVTHAGPDIRRSVVANAERVVGFLDHQLRR